MVSFTCKVILTLLLSGIGYWQSGNVWSAMANQDSFAGTTVNKDLVLNNLNTVFETNPNYASG
jgi:hypothetical protein